MILVILNIEKKGLGFVSSEIFENEKQKKNIVHEPADFERIVFSQKQRFKECKKKT